MRKNHEMRKGRPAAGALFFFAALLWGTALTAADQVFCTTFPVYLFTRNIMQGAPRQPELLLPANLGCPHDYAVTPQDLRKVSGGSPLLIANGAGLDNAVCEALKKANPSLRVCYASDGEEETAGASAGSSGAVCRAAGDGDGQTSCPGEGHSHHHHHGHGVTGGENPHNFASPGHAAELVKSIASHLCKEDPSSAELYRKNLEVYLSKLRQLSEEMSRAAKKFSGKSVLAQHDVFEYAAKELGLKMVAVIQTEPGENPSASELIGLIRLAKKEKISLILAEPQYPTDVAEMIGRETGVPVLLLDPVANGSADAPLDYYESTMRKNLSLLERHLGQ